MQERESKEINELIKDKKGEIKVKGKREMAVNEIKIEKKRM